MHPPHRFEILQQVAWKRLTREAAAELLGVQPRNVTQLLTLWGTRLAAMDLMIGKLQSPLNTKKDQTILKERLAVLMGTTLRQVNRALERANVVIPPPKTVEIREKKRENAKKRREMHNSHAFDAIAGHLSVAEAAENAEVSVRQMYRLMDKLCAGVGVDYRDLKFATLEMRKEIADRAARAQASE